MTKTSTSSSEKKAKKVTIDELVDLSRAAAAGAAEFQERFAAEDTESRKIVNIMEDFLRTKGRVAYGGAAINAHMSPKNKFYDPALNLPDYDFMTPDPLQDCADLIVEFQKEGFTEVEAKFGIHEGTYKIFVNFRAAADITYMPPEIYERVLKDSSKIEGIRYASPNFLRMNMYLELSRPAGMVSRWEKVYKRLLLLNEEHPIKAGHCSAKLFQPEPATEKSAIRNNRIIGIGIDAGAIFLSGIQYMLDETDVTSNEVVMMMTPHYQQLVVDVVAATQLVPTPYEELGELLPPRTELHTRGGTLVAVIFETVACHSYTTLPSPVGYRMASLDLLIQMYYAMYFAELQGYVPNRLLCVIQALVQMEDEQRRKAVVTGEPAYDVFPLECIGHQPTMPELKRAHRQRVLQKRKELAGVMWKPSSSVRASQRKRKQSQNRKRTTTLRRSRS